MQDRVRLLQATVDDALKKMALNSVHHVVTNPFFGASDLTVRRLQQLSAVVKPSGVLHFAVPASDEDLLRWSATQASSTTASLKYLTTIIVVTKNYIPSNTGQVKTHAQRCHWRLVVFGNGTRTRYPTTGVGDVWDMKNYRNGAERWLDVASRAIGMYEPETGAVWERVVFDPWCINYGSPVAMHRAGVKGVVAVAPGDNIKWGAIMDRMEAEKKQLHLPNI